MADISISPVANANTVTPPQINVRNTAADAAKTGESKAAESIREAAESQKERSEKIRREQLEDVIAVSKDGDTVQATDTSKERLEEDRFGHMEVRQDETATDSVSEKAIDLAKKEAEEGTRSQESIRDNIDETLSQPTKTEEAISQAAEKTVTGESRTEQAIEAGDERADAREAQKEYNEKLASYQGISDMKLEQMYLQGEISKIDFDREMESREETREAENTENNRFSAQMTGAAVLEEQGRQDLNQIETAFSEAANDNMTGAERMEIIETIEAGAAQAANLQAAANVVTDDNASGEETVKRVVFS